MNHEAVAALFYFAASLEAPSLYEHQSIKDSTHNRESNRSELRVRKSSVLKGTICAIERNCSATKFKAK